MNIDVRSLSGRKVIVTGGAGFIGSHLCEKLISIGAEVISIDDLSAGRESNALRFKNNKNYSFVHKDICDNDTEMQSLFANVDTVFHNAASKKNICLDNPQRDLAVNSGGVLNLLQHALDAGVRKFVHASTGSVYGEPQFFPTTEGHPLAPVSYYGVSKLAGERYVDVFRHLYGLDTTILRYFHVYGERQESNEFGGVVSIFLRRITQGKNPVVFGHGEQVRSFTYVKDLVTANIASAIHPVASGQVYNVASGIRVTINELAKGMLEILDPEGNLAVEHGDPLLGDIMDFDVANQKICSELGLNFEQDFWGTLRSALSDTEAYLG